MDKDVREFAANLTRMGFRVYVAQALDGRYGFIADEKGDRVLSFSLDTVSESLSGNYGPPSRTCGTGWVMDQVPSGLQTAQDVEKALRCHPPADCQGWRYFTTVEQHLKAYGESSRFVLFEDQ